MSSGLKGDFEISKIDWRRIFFLLLGMVLFAVVYYIPPLPDAG